MVGRGLIPFVGSFVVFLVFFYLGFSYMGIVITNMLIFAIIGFSFIIGLFFSYWNSGKFRMSHLPLVIGIILVVIGSVMFYGTSSFEGYHVQKMWILSDNVQGIFTLLLVTGILLIITGIKRRRF